MLPVASHRAMPENRWMWSDRPESGARCGCSSMVEHRPSKPGMGVRFRPPAPTRKAIATNREIADASAWQSPSLLVRAMHGASRAPNNVKRSARKGGGAPNPGGPRSARAPVEWRGQQPTSKATEPDYAVSAGAGRRNGGNSCDQRGTVRRRFGMPCRWASVLAAEGAHPASRILTSARTLSVANNQFRQ